MVPLAMALAGRGHDVRWLCVLQAADQFINARQGAAAGAAVALAPGEVSAEAIGHAVGRLLVEPDFGLAAGRVRAEIEGMPSPDDVGAVLEGLR